MAFKKKRNYDLYAKKEGVERVAEIIKAERYKNDFLPKTITLLDTDEAFFEYIESEKYRVIDENGLLIPIISAHNPSDLESRITQNYSDDNKTLTLPIVIVKRKEVKQSEIKNIIDGKSYTYLSIPSTDNGKRNVEHYKIPVPVFVKLIYEVTLITNYLQDANKYDEKMLKFFNDIHDYMVVKGYYIHIKLTNMASEDKLGDINSTNEYKRVYTFEVESRLHNEEDYKVQMGMNGMKINFKTLD